MINRDEFAAHIDQRADQYPAVAALRKAGDPRYFQHQEAVATMFAMLSQQIEVAAMEPFLKARDATVLADAALKGIVPRASVARVRLVVRNMNSTAVTLAAGRRLTDANGLMYEVDRPVTVPAAVSDTEPGAAFVEALQQTVRTVEHVVTDSVGFYAAEVPAALDGRMLASVEVRAADGTAFRYTPGFTNVWPGDRVYHVEADEYQRVFIKFGLGGVVGYQPAKGERLTLILTECNGDVRPALGSPFNLEYAFTPADGRITLEHAELLMAGANPIGMAELRELCRYPSAYDDSAVFHGDFDFLIRKHITNLPFLSVWNEQVEEKVRGPSRDNINRLFVSFVVPSGASRDAMFAEIRRLIERADDSYSVRSVEPVPMPIAVTVRAQVARVHDPAVVEDQIRQAIVGEYGRDSVMARRGMVALQYKRVYEFLRARVAALQDAGSDYSVAIQALDGQQLPEHWRYVSQDSLTVEITAADYNMEVWGR